MTQTPPLFGGSSIRLEFPFVETETARPKRRGERRGGGHRSELVRGEHHRHLSTLGASEERGDRKAAESKAKSRVEKCLGQRGHPIGSLQPGVKGLRC